MRTEGAASIYRTDPISSGRIQVDKERYSALDDK